MGLGVVTYTNTDVVIVGGGLVGASLARALAQLNLSVTLVEKKFLSDQAESLVMDQRALALNLGTLNIFKQLFDLDLSSLGALVQDIYVSDQNGFGRIHLNAISERLPYFGCVVPILRLTKTLQDLVLQDSCVRCVIGECVALTQDADAVYCEIQADTPVSLRARLLIAADGINSKVRHLLNVSVQEKLYGQTALIANVRMRGIKSACAYERFTEDGPLALLPLDQDHMTLVWVMPEHVAAMRQKLPQEMLLQDLQNIMGYRAGVFSEVGSMQAFPLQQVLVGETYLGRVGFLGNAAHSLHPVAGQGFNLSVRDVYAFYQIVKQYRDCLDEPSVIWEEYVKIRSHDQERTARLTDALIALFTKKNIFASLLRNSLMLNLELCPLAKSALNEVMVGLT